MIGLYQFHQPVVLETSGVSRPLTSVFLSELAEVTGEAQKFNGLREQIALATVRGKLMLQGGNRFLHHRVKFDVYSVPFVSLFCHLFYF